jgi:hypothetical protein
MWLLLAATAVAAYTVGRLRLGHRASDWAAWNRVTEACSKRRYRWPSNAIALVEVVHQLVMHPAESRRNIRAFRNRQTAPVPAFDSQWASKRQDDRDAR